MWIPTIQSRNFVTQIKAFMPCTWYIALPTLFTHYEFLICSQDTTMCSMQTQCTSSINSTQSTFCEHMVCSQNQSTHTTHLLHTHNTLLPCNTRLWYTRRIMYLLHILAPPITKLRYTHRTLSHAQRVWRWDYKTLGNIKLILHYAWASTHLIECHQY